MSEIMYSSSAPQTIRSDANLIDRFNIRAILLIVIASIGIGVTLFVANLYQGMSNDDPLYANSTPGLLAVWMADQSSLESPVSILGQYSRNWALQAGIDSLDPQTVLSALRGALVGFCLMMAGVGILGVIGVWWRTRWHLIALLSLLLGLDSLLFIIPPIDQTVVLILLSITILALGLLFLPAKSNRVIGFVVILSLSLVAWEGTKTLANRLGYQVNADLPEWEYTAYPTLDDALRVLQDGEVDAVIVDRRGVDDLIDPYPPSQNTTEELFEYTSLRTLNNFASSEQILLFPLTQSLPGRLRVVVREEDVERWQNTQVLVQQPIGTVEGDFAEVNFLGEPRQVTLLELKIFNNINLPHLQTISAALWQPARRNGPLLLVRILMEAGLHTWGEAVIGFAIGATFGFLLGTALAHSRMLQRGLLPYVIASQTIPIIAIAPIVVIWLGAGTFAIAIIASYLTFFPVTINTLRGLNSPDPTALELMRSYAASPWSIMWKLRFPAALPYIFTALKVSATASVVGAIVGELPSGVPNGLGRTIVNFSSDYSVISTPKLWGAIIIAALVGITFFLIVSLIEFAVLRGRGTQRNR